MKGKWAEGIVPRNFHWIIKDQLAVCERPGGYGMNHRRVRRQEEIIWIREQGFGRVISLLPSTHNLHNYDELQVAWEHIPFPPHEEAGEVLGRLYPRIRELLGAGERVLLHQEELGDRVVGTVAGYLAWAGLLPDAPRVIAVVERIVGRQLGPLGRELVNAGMSLPNARRRG